MTPFLQLTLALAILIAAAKLGGYLSYRLGQPSVLGELLVGILLGPSVVDLLNLTYFSDAHLPEVIHQLAELGVMLLMFIAGLELHVSDLLKSGKVAAFSGTLGVILPLGMGIGLGLAYAMELPEAIFIGLILSATSVSISAQTLMELKVLRSRVGLSLLGAAVFDDVLVVLGLSIFTALSDSSMANGGLTSVLGLLLRMILYLGIATTIGMLVMPRLSRKVHGMPVSQGLLAFTVVLLLLYGWAAEELGGMAAISGAFLAGLTLAQSPVKERIESGVSALAYGFLVPVFFINVGLTANIRQISAGTVGFFLLMTLIAVVSKVLGAGLGANLSGLSRLESLQLGIGMVSRGEVGLIVASVGIAQGLINQEIFAAVVGVIIITTLLTPPLLRAAFSRPQPKAAPPKAPDSDNKNPPDQGETA